jgi:hypothetical protein
MGSRVFPLPQSTGETDGANEGLEKREYYAASALTGILSGARIIDPRAAATLAVECADALLAALGDEGGRSG